ncbi:MAG: tetratricopeptide repeat protein [Tagaea sp.]
MPQDRNGYALSTNAACAAAYNDGVEKLLSANAGAAAAFARALDADPAYAPAFAALARHHQVHANRAEAKAAVTSAREHAARVTGREASHVNCLALVVEGKADAALPAIHEHIRAYPRDSLALSPCCGVFGLYGFSGRAGRDAELRAYMDSLASGFGEDWWFLVQHGFALVETFDAARGLAKLARALELFPREANGAHIRAHARYELGETKAGLDELTQWAKDYARDSLLHCHLDWHRALWSLALGRQDEAWALYRAGVAPGAIWGPSLNVATDAAAFLLRAELAGAARDRAEWNRVAEYCAAEFPRAGIAFLDVHALLASALAGDEAGFAERKAGLRGPAADIVAGLADAFDAFAKDRPGACADFLAPWLATHERIGGSRAQRDLLEELHIAALTRAGRTAEAAAYAKTRRRGL